MGFQSHLHFIPAGSKDLDTALYTSLNQLLMIDLPFKTASLNELDFLQSSEKNIVHAMEIELSDIT